LAVAGADFIFNRQNQLTPYSSLNYYAPGQAPPQGQQVQFNQDFLTGPAQQLFSQQSADRGNGGFVPTPSGPTGPSTRAMTQQVSPSSFGGPRQSQGGKYANGGSGAPPSQAGDITIPSGDGRDIRANFGGLQNATAVQRLSPAMLALENARMSQTANTLSEGLRRQNEVANGALPELISGVNTQGLGSGQVASGGGLPAIPGSPEQFQQGITQTMYDLGSRQMDRTFNRDFGTIEQRLANQGLALNSEAASNVMGDFFNERNLALGDLASRSVLAGGQESSRALNDITSLRSQGFAEQGQQFGQTEGQRQARLQEQMMNAGLASNSRSQGINELNALLGLPQVNAPGLNSFMGSNGTDVTGAYGLNLQGQMANANNEAAAKGGQMGALGNIGSAAAMAMIMSSREFKETIGPQSSILERLASIPVDRWKYHGDDAVHIGPYAEDFNRAFDLGESQYISVIDYLGVILGAIKELSAKVAHGQ
jgi:hypothetical protein